jgi:hypothetical protein
MDTIERMILGGLAGLLLAVFGRPLWKWLRRNVKPPQ